jgi:transcriptional regulator with XRE-family HTH domain
MSTPDPRSTFGRSDELGRLLAQLRSDRNMAQKQVALLAEIDGSTLSRLESGGRGVSREVLERICTVLDLDRKQRLDVLVAAGMLTEEASRLLGDDAVARLARLLTEEHVSEAHRTLLRQYVMLALAHADALGYDAE